MIKNKKACILVQDEDCHWYIIAQFEREDFDRWVEDTRNDKESDFDFNGNRIDGPDRILIFDWGEA